MVRALQRIPGVYVCIKESQTAAVIITLSFDATNLIDLILIGLFHLGFPAFKDVYMLINRQTRFSGLSTDTISAFHSRAVCFNMQEVGLFIVKHQQSVKFQCKSCTSLFT